MMCMTTCTVDNLCSPLVLQLTSEISNIVPDIIKPFVDLVWFTHQAWLLAGWRNTAMLYSYLVTGLGVLHVITPAFDTLVMSLTKLQAGLRCVHVHAYPVV